jgi:hypothetical protein
MNTLDNIEVFDDLMPIASPARFAEDNKLYVTLYRKAVKNEFKSLQENRPVFEEKDYIRIIVPGDKNSEVDTPVDEFYINRFKDKYNAYKKGQGNKRVGTPLEAWPTIGLAQVAELNALKLTMVEDIANCSGALGQKIMGFHDLQRRAIAFLEASKEAAKEKELDAKIEAAVAKSQPKAAEPSTDVKHKA